MAQQMAEAQMMVQSVQQAAQAAAEAAKALREVGVQQKAALQRPTRRCSVLVSLAMWCHLRTRMDGLTFPFRFGSGFVLQMPVTLQILPTLKSIVILW